MATWMSRRSGRRGAGVVAGAVTFVLLLSSCGTFSGGDDGSDAKVPTASLLRTVRVPPQQVDESAHFWAHGRVFARLGERSVVGYRASDARKAWSVTFDGKVCNASEETTKDGELAVMYAGPRDHECAHVAAVDVVSGKKLWQRKVDAHGKPSMAVADGVVAVAGDDAGRAWRVRDGKPLWKKKAEPAGGCFDASYTGGRHASLLVTLQSCPDSSNSFEVLGRNARTGRAAFHYRPQNKENAAVLSAHPVVLAVEKSSGSTTHALALTNHGKVRSRFRLGDGWSSDGVVTRDRLYQYGTDGKHAALRAVDLNTGRVKGYATFGKRQLRPVRMRGNKLLAYASPGKAGGSLVSVDPATLKTKEIMRNSGSAHVEGLLDVPRPYFESGRLYLYANAALKEKLTRRVFVFGRE